MPKQKQKPTFRTKNLRSPAVQHRPHRLGTIRQSSIVTTSQNRKPTVTLKLIPTVLALTAHVDSTSTNTTQKNAVMKVLPARDHLRPNLVSMSQAPSFIYLKSISPVQQVNSRKKRGRRTMAPGHPPIVKITTSHKLCSRVFVGGTDDDPAVDPPVSRSLGR